MVKNYGFEFKSGNFSFAFGEGGSKISLRVADPKKGINILFANFFSKNA